VDVAVPDDRTDDTGLREILAEQAPMGGGVMGNPLRAADPSLAVEAKYVRPQFG
jgi:hypothetical protein